MCKCIQKVQKHQQNQDLTLPVLLSSVSWTLKNWSFLKCLRDLQVSDKILICKSKQLCELGDMGYELDCLRSFRSLSKTIFISTNISAMSTPFPYLSSTYFLLSLDFMFHLFPPTGISAVITSSTVMVHIRVREGKVH